MSWLFLLVFLIPASVRVKWNAEDGSRVFSFKPLGQALVEELLARLGEKERKDSPREV